MENGKRLVWYVFRISILENGVCKMEMEKEKRQFVSSVIGDDYETWERGRKVLITAPTGSGKTTFVFEKLLKRVVREKEIMLYLVNRKVLKEQLKHDLKKYDKEYKVNGMPGQQHRNIIFMTYQQLEEAIRKDEVYPRLYNCKYIVCDEAHYFIADSTFNTNTYLSYEFVTKRFTSAITVFISATLDSMAEFMPEIESIQRNKTFYGDMKTDGYSNELVSRLFWKDTSVYTLPKDYSYLNIHVFQTFDEMIKQIMESEEEYWLIFYNNILEGNKLVNKLNELGIDAVFVDADFENDEIAYGEVKHIVERGEIKSRVVCATSLLDNGISLKQSSLRNMVIIAENEIEFIQMLGRKRRDDKNVEVYLFMGSGEEFNQRLFQLRKCKEQMEEASKLISSMKYAELMEGILSSDEMYNAVKRFLFFRNEQTVYVLGNPDSYLKIQLNPFAQYSIANQCIFYEQQLEAMKKNPSAYLDTQLKWLDIPEENITKNKKEALLKAKEECRLEILNQLVNNTNIKYHKWEIDDKWNTLAEQFKVYFNYAYSLAVLNGEDENASKYINHKNYVGKKRGVSIKRFDEIMDIMGIPLKMSLDETSGEDTKEAEKRYIIKYFGE